MWVADTGIKVLSARVTVTTEEFRFMKTTQNGFKNPKCIAVTTSFKWIYTVRWISPGPTHKVLVSVQQLQWSIRCSRIVFSQMFFGLLTSSEWLWLITTSQSLIKQGAQHWSIKPNHWFDRMGELIHWLNFCGRWNKCWLVWSAMSILHLDCRRWGI